MRGKRRRWSTGAAEDGADKAARHRLLQELISGRRRGGRWFEHRG